MSTHQDSRTRRRLRRRRAIKNEKWLAKRSEQNAAEAKPKQPAKKAT